MSKKPNPPKSGGKNKKTEAHSELKYGIFVVNFDKSLWPIATEFGKELQKYERRAVIGFSREDIVKEILIEQEKAKKDKESKALTGKDTKDNKDEKRGKKAKDKKENKDKDSPKIQEATKEEVQKKHVKAPEIDKEAKPIDPKIFVLDEKTFDVFNFKVKEHIDSSVKKIEAIARSMKARQDFDLLKYWEEKDDSVSKKDDSKRNKGKGKNGLLSAKKDAKESRARGGAEKVKGKKEGEKDGHKDKRKEDKVKADETECALKELKQVELDEKAWSKIQPTVYNYPMKFKV